jgi:sec-independent protein translocase protein TatA
MQTLAIFQLGGWEVMILLILGLLIFGRRLPEVGKSLGKGIVEFKKGLQGIEDEIEHATHKPSSPPKQIDKPPAEQTTAQHDPHDADIEHGVEQKSEQKADV